jgi:hypothetical protein
MSTRLPAPPAPGPWEDYVAHFDALLAMLAQRRNFRHYLQGLLLPYVRTMWLFLCPSDGTSLSDTVRKRSGPEGELLRLLLGLLPDYRYNGWYLAPDPTNNEPQTARADLSVGQSLASLTSPADTRHGTEEDPLAGRDGSAARTGGNRLGSLGADVTVCGRASAHAGPGRVCAADAGPRRGSDDGGWWVPDRKCDKIDTKGSQKGTHAAEAPEGGDYGRRSVFILSALALPHTRIPDQIRPAFGLRVTVAAHPSRPGPLVVPLLDIEQGVTA